MTNALRTPEIDATRFRRVHTKSRKGCATCKRRKIKCDEKFPLCGNCERCYGGLTSCDYGNFVDIQPSKKTRKLISKSTYTILHSATPQSPTQHPDSTTPIMSRVLELRLIHHYSMFTSRELPVVSSVEGSSLSSQVEPTIWTIDVPRLAFSSNSSPAMTDSVLGLAAQHLCALESSTPNADPKEMKVLSFAAGWYFDQALQKHRSGLATPNESSAETLLAAAIIITHHTWVAAHSEAPGNHREKYKLPLTTYHMALGLQVLFQQLFPWLQQSEYLWYLHANQSKDSVEDSMEGEINGFCASNPFLIAAKEDVSSFLSELERSGGKDEDLHMYTEVTQELTSLYEAICQQKQQSTVRTLAATFPLRTPPVFLKLLEAEDPAAMALLARNLACLKLLEPQWWLHGAGSHMVADRSIKGIRSLMPPDWLWAMEWPKKVLSGEIGFIG